MPRTTVNAKEVIGRERDPVKDGAKLAGYIIVEKCPLRGLEIDVTALAPEDIVSSFVNAMMHALAAAGQALEEADHIKWRAKFPAEARRLEELVRLYVEDSRSIGKHVPAIVRKSSAAH